MSYAYLFKYIIIGDTGKYEIVYVLISSMVACIVVSGEGSRDALRASRVLLDRRRAFAR